MEIQFLGTGAGMPTKFRNTSSIVLNLRSEGDGYWLFDCGEATQHQLQYTSTKPGKINKIFITHLHGDHLFGLPGFLSSRSFLGGDDMLEIYGPIGLKRWIEVTLETTMTHLAYPYVVHEIEKDGLLCETDQFYVYAYELEHVIPSYGFRVEQKEQLGALLVDKVIEAKVPRGPLYRELKEGKDVQLPDGTVVRSEDVTAPKQKGFVVTICGDTRYSKKSIQAARQADVLIHEGTFEASMKDLAYQYGHSSFEDAAYVASEAKAKHLIVTHISARFDQEDLVLLRKEGERYFQPLYIAKDFARYTWQNDTLHEHSS